MKKLAICSIAILLVGCASEYTALNASWLDGGNKTTQMSNVAIGRSPISGQVKDPAEYYSDRVNALMLVRQEDWSQALPLLEQLTTQYQDDGATWYLLGLAYLQDQRWEAAIACLTRTLELGTVLHNIPTGSSPSNDIMIKIAGSYSRLGDKDAAIEWVWRALQARYDERPRLTGNHPFLGRYGEFEAIETSKAFQRVAGSYRNENLSRDDAWKEDLKFLVSEVSRLHVNLYHTIQRQLSWPVQRQLTWPVDAEPMIPS
ncbi:MULTISPECIES: tetratricopeptide repeat protein, partial [unclassified Gilvimarinus]|uniref:tetratricopeptide repeat protein n=1 Tax=Gilvimarinus sp. DZF01 TaxID=3461371 RepID=UPI0040467DD3